MNTITNTVRQRADRPVMGLVVRALVFAGLWWGLTEGSVDSWIVGIPAVMGAAIASYLLRSQRSPRWHVSGVIAFAAFFVLESLRAGVDVARRAVTLKIAPQVIEYESRLEDETALTLFCGTLSLLPGTLTVEMRERTLLIHTLDSRQPVREELRKLECHIAAIFGSPIQVTN